MRVNISGKIEGIDRLRQRLLHRIHRRFATAQQTIDLGALSLPFTRIANPNAVLDAVVAQEDALFRDPKSRPACDPPQLPYWAELWDSSFGIAAHLTGKNLTGVRALDLGCGMGLAGLAAAAAGADVVLADIEPLALLLARLNCLPLAHRTKIRRLDWQRDRLPLRFNLILGSDILYDRAQWPYLHDFWLNHLATNGRILLGEPGRQTGEEFPAWASQRGWRLHEQHQPVQTQPRAIRIFELN